MLRIRNKNPEQEAAQSCENGSFGKKWKKMEKNENLERRDIICKSITQ